MSGNVARKLSSVLFRWVRCPFPEVQVYKPKCSALLSSRKYQDIRTIFRFPVSLLAENVGIQYLPFFWNDMGKKAGGFYAVARGRGVGIYQTWDDCKAQVDGFPNARYKKFPTSNEAQAFIEEHKVKTKTGGGTSVATGTVTAGKSQANNANSLPKTGVPTSSFLSKRNTRIGTGTNTGPAKSTILLQSPPVFSKTAIPPSKGPTRTAQKRDLSYLKVTEDRVVNKRAKFDPGTPNKKADLGSFNVDDEGYVVVFTDGACAKNGRKAAKAGIGVWFGHNHPLNISEPVDGRQTNNTAEIQAAERAIKQAKENGINKLKLKTDSQFTINCVTKWMNNWRRKNWRLSTGGEVKNKEDLIKLDEAMQNMEIKWSYVAGHAGIEGNEAADRLAVAGAERSK